MSDQIKSWSPSRLQVYETCPFRAALQFIDRIPDPSPKPAADRGTRIHQLAEDYASGKIDGLPAELRHFAPEFSRLRELHDDAKVMMEDEWGYDHTWQPTDYATAWLRLKLDVAVWLAPDEICVIDHKTGKRYGNEIKHGEQTQIYACAVVARFPEVKIIHTELWYLDQDELGYAKYTREQALKHLARWHGRGEKCTAPHPQGFKAQISQHSCKWCPYSANGTGHCTSQFGKRLETA